MGAANYTPANEGAGTSGVLVGALVAVLLLVLCVAIVAFVFLRRTTDAVLPYCVCGTYIVRSVSNRLIMCSSFTSASTAVLSCNGTHGESHTSVHMRVKEFA